MGIGASIFLLALGAILAFAVNINDSLVAGISIDWYVVGVILMIVGLVGLLWSVIALNSLRRSHTHTVVDDRPVDRIDVR